MYKLLKQSKFFTELMCSSLSGGLSLYLGTVQNRKTPLWCDAFIIKNKAEKIKLQS